MRKLSSEQIWHYAGYIILAIVAAAPLTLGAVAPWAWASLVVLSGLILLSVALSTIADYGAPSFHWNEIRLPVFLFAAATAWGFFQLLAVPREWLHPIWQVTGDILGTTQGAISLNPTDGQQVLVRWLGYATIFLIAYVWGRDARRAMQALNLLVIVGTIYAIYGLIIVFAGSDLALWVHKPMYQPDVSGPFINKNNFATYVGALLCITMGLLIRRVMRDASGVGGHEFWRHMIGLLLGRAWYLLVAVIVLFTALLLSHSRAGLISFVAGLVTLLLLLRLAGVLRGRMFFWGIGVMTVFLFAMFLFSGEGVFIRMISNDEPARPQLYALEWSAILDRPWLGHGLGSFPQIFHIYRTEDIPYDFFTERGHSVYLENILELGFPAALLLFVAVGVCLWRMMASTAMDARHRTIPAVTAAAGVVMVVHSLIDFPLQIPAISMIFSYLLGLGMAQVKK
jgi:O-antigen ligase